MTKFFKKTISIDNELPTDRQMEEIKNSSCIQCHRPYDEKRRIMFVYTCQKGVIWWHLKNYFNDKVDCKKIYTY